MTDPLYCIGRREAIICAMLLLTSIKIVFAVCYIIFCRPEKNDFYTESNQIPARQLGGAAMGQLQASMKNFSEATADSAEAGSRIVAAGGQVAIGAVAVPLSVVGSLAEGSGEVANEIADDMWETANKPLKVDDDVVVAQDAPRLSSQSDKAGEQ